MKGKLFKMVDGYKLSLTGNIEDLYGISNDQLAEDQKVHKLSLNNCQAIENGYDLDELAENILKSHRDFNTEGFNDYQNGRLNGIYEGFQKAIEILGDSGTSSSGTSSKKFNTEFILNLVPIVLEKHKSLNITEFNDWYNSDFLKMLFDKKEWIVEIEMEIPPATYGHSGWHEQPKLDSNGCLIIKPVI